MFQHQDVLYRNGPLALVWLVGNGGLKSKGKKSKMMQSILKASIAHLCDKITEVMKIPRPFGGRGASWSQENVLDIKTISILVLGLSTMQKEQIIQFKREVDALYESCRWRMPMFVESQTAIDLPNERNLIQDVSLNITQQEEFGEMFIREEFVHEGSPRTVYQIEERNEETVVASTVAEDDIDMTNVNVIDLLKRNKAEQKRAAKRAKSRPQNDDDGILRILKNSLARANAAAVTLPEIDQLRLDPSHIEGEGGDFFGENLNLNDTEQHVPVNQGDSPMTVVNRTDDRPSTIEEMEIDPPTTTTDLTHDLTSRNPTTPPSMEPNSLQRMIQQDTPDSLEAYVGPPRNKRRRTYWLRADEVIEFSSDDLRSNVQATQHLSDEERHRLLNAGLAPVPPPHHALPTMLRTNAQVIESIQQFWGRRLGKNLSSMLGVNMQNRLLNISTEERRREGSTAAAAAENVSNALPIAPDASTTNPTSSPDPQRDQLPMSPARESQENQLDLEPVMEQPDVTVAEEQRTPQRPVEEMDEVAGRSLIGEIEMQDANETYFHERWPPAISTKLEAALQFQRLLKLQAQKEIILEQKRFCGPIKIILLNTPSVSVG